MNNALKIWIKIDKNFFKIFFFIIEISDNSFNLYRCDCISKNTILIEYKIKYLLFFRTYASRCYFKKYFSITDHFKKKKKKTNFNYQFDIIIRFVNFINYNLLFEIHHSFLWLRHIKSHGTNNGLKILKSSFAISIQMDSIHRPH